MLNIFRRKKNFTVVILLLFLFLSTPLLGAYAADESLFSKNPFFGISGLTEKCVDYGKCTLCDMTLVGIRISRFILGVSGAASLLLFVVGGAFFIFSAGNKTLVDKGKSILKGAVIGILIIFGAWQAINIIITAFVVSEKVNSVGATTPNVFGQNWATLKCVEITK